MILSNDRKLTLCGWLKKHDCNLFNNTLKLQNFLLFYETLSKVLGKEADFSNLKGYKNGPVFSNVWGDHTKERDIFQKTILEVYEKNSDIIDENIAKKASFIVKILNEKELSDLTHQLNIYKTKESLIVNGGYHVRLYEDDFNEKDAELIKLLDQMYNIEMIDNSEVISINNNHFIISKEDVKRLEDEHYDTIRELSKNVELNNPVFVEIDEEGRLLVD